ncbi:MAG TPA: SurA N-terminal domain-containing protein [Candidatus Saccharimonadales bacterium]
MTKKQHRSNLRRALRPRLPKRLKRIKLPKNPLRRGKGDEVDNRLVEAIQNLPRITNETVAEHREEVLSSARKYIYPLSHSKRRVVSITVGLLILAVVVFFAYCGIAVYKLQSSSTFIYTVSKVIPFPAARVGSSWVSYESYLFELRHTMHYYVSQQQENFSTAAGKRHLAQLRQQAMAQVVQDAYVKQLAAKYHVSVSDQAVDNEVSLVRQQNRLGSSNQVFDEVLSEFWGWTQADFKRELKMQLLTQAVVSKLDTGAWARANSALSQLQNGASFATLAAQDSDDTTTKGNDGNYGFAIDRSNSDIAPQVVGALFQLQPGQTSGIINTGYSLEIDKVTSISDGKVNAAHIVFDFKPISAYIQPLQKSEKPHQFIQS